MAMVQKYCPLKQAITQRLIIPVLEDEH